MNPQVSRRSVLKAVPAAGVAGLLPGCATTIAAGAGPPSLYRTEDAARILAVAREIIREDRIASLVTIDANGVPRVRPVGVAPVGDDLVFWIGTRRRSRKVTQVRGNPNAALLFNFDDIAGNFENAYYASFMGTATAHTDEATLSLRQPPEQLRRALWPDYPNDFAAIIFRPRWLEVYGKGIQPADDSWQPQGIMVPAPPLAASR